MRVANCSLTLARRALFLSVLLAGCAAWALPKQAARSAAAAPPVGRLIIQYKTGVKLAGQAGATVVTERLEAAAQVQRLATAVGATELRYLKSVSARMHVVTLAQPVAATEARVLIQKLQADPAVEFVVPDVRVRPHLVPNDPLFAGGAFADQWHLQSSALVAGAINAATAWDSSTGSGVVVAVLDGGYRPHTDLATNLVMPGYDFINGDTAEGLWTANDSDAGRDADAQDPGDWVSEPEASVYDCAVEDSSWHGTHVAGLVGAVANNAQGGAGVAYGALVLPVRVLGRCGGFNSDILAGARWAAGLSVVGVPANPTPARVLNLSLGVDTDCDAASRNVVNEIRALNVSIVASTGNEGYEDRITSPANCPGVVAVTAHTRDGDSADYANVGMGTSISAPGGGDNSVLPSSIGEPRFVVSTGNAGLTTPGADNYLEYAGTSMAAPQVAGVLALLASLRPDLSMADLEQVVRTSARAFPAGSYCTFYPGVCGSGLLDAAAAVEAARNWVPSSGGDSGGGCTVGGPGQADAGLPLLAGIAALALLWRRRSVVR